MLLHRKGVNFKMVRFCRRGTKNFVPMHVNLAVAFPKIVDGTKATTLHHDELEASGGYLARPLLC